MVIVSCGIIGIGSNLLFGIWIESCNGLLMVFYLKCLNVEIRIYIIIFIILVYLGLVV